MPRVLQVTVSVIEVVLAALLAAAAVLVARLIL
jgi:hypothetical protein